MPDNYIDLAKQPELARQRMNDARDRIEGALGQAMEKALSIIEADAKRECTVDTGRLRASITHETKKNGSELRGRIGTNVEYAPYYHEGTGIYATNGQGRKTPWLYKDRKGIGHFTRGMKPRPFLRNAVDKNKGKIGEIFQGVLRQL